jgi:hypothetical protein
MSVEKNVPRLVADLTYCDRTRRDNHASSCIQRYTLQHKIRAQIVSTTPRTEAVTPLKVELLARDVEWETTLDASLKTEIHPHLTPLLIPPLSSPHPTAFGRKQARAGILFAEGSGTERQLAQSAWGTAAGGGVRTPFNLC